MRGLVHREGLVPRPLRDRIEAELDFAWWARSTVASFDGARGWVSSMRTSETFFQRHFTSQLLDAVGDLDVILERELGIELASLEGWQALRYGPGTSFEEHHDDCAGRLNRVVSLVVFLRAPEGGGQLCFPCHDLTIEPVAGDVVVWINRWPDGVPDLLASHLIVPVTAGTRLSLVNWASSSPTNQPEWSL